MYALIYLWETDFKQLLVDNLHLVDGFIYNIKL